MLNRLVGALSLYVSRAADRGNPLAQRLVARALRQAYDAIPQSSPIARGEFLIPDPDRAPLDDDEDDDSGPEGCVPLVPAPVTEADLVGQTVEDLATSLGSYGLGGYGFFGLLLADRWLIVPIHNAPQWIALDGRMLEDLTGVVPDPWIRNGDDRALIRRLRGARITSATLSAKGMALRFDNGAGLRIDDDPKTRPVLPGNGRLRAFLPEDNLQDALFFSPSGEIYL